MSFGSVKLQTVLRAKAKESPDYRFYALYDKVYRADVLAYAYERCLQNRGAAGVDGQTFEAIESIKMWLESAVEETDERGRRHRTTRSKDEGRGTPQGGVLSPLLANLYMRRFVLGWKVCGHEKRLDAHIVNYADDFVICCKPGRALEALAAMRQMMGRLRLTVNEKKTGLRRLPEEAFDFLGFTFGRQVSWKTGRSYIGPMPAKKKVLAICKRIGEVASRSMLWRDVEEQVGRLNQVLIGWANYFRLGYVTGAWKVVQQHACRRLRRWMCRKHGQSGGVSGYPDLQLYEKYGLVKLTVAVRRVPLWA